MRHYGGGKYRIVAVGWNAQNGPNNLQKLIIYKAVQIPSNTFCQQCQCRSCNNLVPKAAAIATAKTANPVGKAAVDTDKDIDKGSDRVWVLPECEIVERYEPVEEL